MRKVMWSNACILQKRTSWREHLLLVWASSICILPIKMFSNKVIVFFFILLHQKAWPFIWFIHANPQLPRMLCVSLDKIGHMVLKCSCFIFVTQLLSPFNKGFDYSLKKKLESPAFKIFISLFLLFFFFAKFGCSWSCGSRNGNGENTLRW